MFAILIAVIAVIIDQISKIVISSNMGLGSSKPIIDGVLHIKYIHNDGGIFGSMSGNSTMLLVFSLLIIALLCFIIYKYHSQSRVFDICLGLMLGGGVGNIIDRIRIGKVIDFIDFCAFDFWTYIFNIADCAVVCGCLLAIVYVFMDSKNTNNQNKKYLAEARQEYLSRMSEDESGEQVPDSENTDE